MNRDDWPLSGYAMYAYLTSDHKHNPYSPRCDELETTAASCLLLVLIFENGHAEVASTEANQVLWPFTRTDIVLLLTQRQRREGHTAVLLNEILRLIRDSGHKKAHSLVGLELRSRGWIGTSGNYCRGSEIYVERTIDVVFVRRRDSSVLRGEAIKSSLCCCI